MKKIFALMAIAAAALIMTSCGGGSGSPKDVADKFTKAFVEDFDIETAFKYCNDSAKKELGGDFSEMKSEYPELFTAMREAVKTLKISFTHDAENSWEREDAAHVAYDLKSGSNPDYERKGYVDLKKENGKWAVSNAEMPLDIF